MTEHEKRELIADIVAHAISIGIATKQGRMDDRKKYLDEIRRILQEALAE